MCFKRCKKAKGKSKGSTKIANVSNKQIAQYIVIDLERMQSEERKTKENNSMFHMKTNDDNMFFKNDKKQGEENQQELFCYNFMEAPPTNLNPLNVLNEDFILKTEEIHIENI